MRFPYRALIDAIQELDEAMDATVAADKARNEGLRIRDGAYGAEAPERARLARAYGTACAAEVAAQGHVKDAARNAGIYTGART